MEDNGGQIPKFMGFKLPHTKIKSSTSKEIELVFVDYKKLKSVLYQYYKNTLPFFKHRFLLILVVQETFCLP